MDHEGPSTGDPVSVWIDELRNSEGEAAEKLWNHFVARLYESARKKLNARSRAVYDEEDAVQSAFHSVCNGIATGRFPKLRDRESLLRLLLVITSRKVARRHQYDQRHVRDVRRNISTKVFAESTEETLEFGVEHLPTREPTPEFAAQFAETCEQLFERMDDPRLRDIVTLRMEGYSDSEIAARLDCSRRTVQRSLEIIRRQWSRQEQVGD